MLNLKVNNADSSNTGVKVGRSRAWEYLMIRWMKSRQVGVNDSMSISMLFNEEQIRQYRLQFRPFCFEIILRESGMQENSLSPDMLEYDWSKPPILPELPSTYRHGYPHLFLFYYCFTYLKLFHFMFLSYLHPYLITIYSISLSTTYPQSFISHSTEGKSYYLYPLFVLLLITFLVIFTYNRLA